MADKKNKSQNNKNTKFSPQEEYSPSSYGPQEEYSPAPASGGGGSDNPHRGGGPGGGSRTYQCQEAPACYGKIGSPGDNLSYCMDCDDEVCCSTSPYECHWGVCPWGQICSSCCYVSPGPWSWDPSVVACTSKCNNASEEASCWVNGDYEGGYGDWSECTDQSAIPFWEGIYGLYSECTAAPSSNGFGGIFVLGKNCVDLLDLGQCPYGSTSLGDHTTIGTYPVFGCDLEGHSDPTNAAHNCNYIPEALTGEELGGQSLCYSLQNLRDHNLNQNICLCNGWMTDTCGVCGGNGIPDGACDCDGHTNEGCGCNEPGPSGCNNSCDNPLENDCCDVCGGDAVCPAGECGECGGGGTLDSCDVCSGGSSGHTANSDDVGCGCFEAEPSGCDNACGSNLADDECGECGGPGIGSCAGSNGYMAIAAGITQCWDCAGNPFDDCAVGGGQNWFPSCCVGYLCEDGNTCLGDEDNTTGLPCGCTTETIGETIIYAGDDVDQLDPITVTMSATITHTFDCAGGCGGTKVLDECEICGGGNACECGNGLHNCDCCECADTTFSCQDFSGTEVCTDFCGCLEEDLLPCPGGSCGTNIPEGKCDCAGNTIDVCGVCGGHFPEYGNMYASDFVCPGSPWYPVVDTDGRPCSCSGQFCDPWGHCGGNGDGMNYCEGGLVDCDGIGDLQICPGDPLCRQGWNVNTAAPSYGRSGDAAIDQRGLTTLPCTEETDCPKGLDCVDSMCERVPVKDRGPNRETVCDGKYHVVYDEFGWGGESWRGVDAWRLPMPEWWMNEYGDSYHNGEYPIEVPISQWGGNTNFAMTHGGVSWCYYMNMYCGGGYPCGGGDGRVVVLLPWGALYTCPNSNDCDGFVCGGPYSNFSKCNAISYWYEDWMKVGCADPLWDTGEEGPYRPQCIARQSSGSGLTVEDTHCFHIHDPHCCIGEDPLGFDYDTGRMFVPKTITGNTAECHLKPACRNNGFDCAALDIPACLDAQAKDLGCNYICGADDGCGQTELPGAGYFNCSASLVGPTQNWVLTGAHCGSPTQVVLGIHENTDGILLGSYDGSTPPGGFTEGIWAGRIDYRYVHHLYDHQNNTSDYMLLHLKDPAPRRFKPIQINTDKSLEQNGGELISIGIGQTVPGAPYEEWGDVLREATTEVRGYDCGDWPWYHFPVDTTHFCAGGCWEECWPDCPMVCDGDSGGPNIMYPPSPNNYPSGPEHAVGGPAAMRSDPVLVGLSSIMPIACICPMGDDGVPEDKPPIFASVAEGSSWINQYINSPEAPPIPYVPSEPFCDYDCNYVIEACWQINAQYGDDTITQEVMISYCENQVGGTQCGWDYSAQMCNCLTDCCPGGGGVAGNNNFDPEIPWHREAAMGTGWTYRSAETADTRIVGGTEVNPACPNCKYPFYAIIGSGTPVPYPDEDGPGGGPQPGPGWTEPTPGHARPQIPKPKPSPFVPGPEPTPMLEECQTDRDCRAGQICVGGMCRSQAGPGQTDPPTKSPGIIDMFDSSDICENDRDCKLNQICVAGTCRNKTNQRR